MDISDRFKGEVRCPTTVDRLIARLLSLDAKRMQQHESHRKKLRRRQTLRSTSRKEVFEKTGRRCHICGGLLTEHWQADHILAYSKDGPHDPENFLPAHRLCNNYRWDYLSEEFQWILKMGVWACTLIKNSPPEGSESLGRRMAEGFWKYDKRRDKRRKKPSGLAR
jgi:hypothetical protein